MGKIQKKNTEKDDLSDTSTITRALKICLLKKRQCFHWWMDKQKQNIYFAIHLDIIKGILCIVCRSESF